MNRRDMLLSATLMAAGIAGSQLSSSAATAATSDEKKSPARNVNEAVVRYLAAWNERDASRRLELVGANIGARRVGDQANGIAEELAQPACDIESIDLRQSQIQQDAVRGQTARLL